MRSDSRLPQLDDEFIARKRKLDELARPSVSNTIDWVEIRSCARDIILVASIVAMAVFGIAAIYAQAAASVAIVCQEGC